MSKTRIYVSAHRIGERIMGKDAAYPITVEYPDGTVMHATAVSIDGPSTVRYAPDTPNPAGARCWIETDARVVGTPDSTSVQIT